MTDLPITLTCADYARVMPLATGAIKPKGIQLTMILGRSGHWPARAEMLRRATQDSSVDGGEGSMAQHLYRIDKGDRSHVGLPIFPLRNFTARDIYVRRGSKIREAQDLAGARVGMYSFTASGSLWYRHLLRYLNVDPASIEWWVGDVDQAWSTTAPPPPPKGTHAPPAGKSLTQMLLDDELDAVLSPPRPQKYHPMNGPIVRLFPEFPKLEERYFRDTGAFPPQHLVTVRRAVWEKNPWIAKSLTDAFIACEAEFIASQRGFPYATPWFEAELEFTDAAMGENFHPHGLDPNRRAMEQFAKQAHLLGLTSRRVTVEDYFAEYLESATYQ
jgi:4,5-dihydroxyphthalate decarboxylase